LFGDLSLKSVLLGKIGKKHKFTKSGPVGQNLLMAKVGITASNDKPINII